MAALVAIPPAMLLAYEIVLGWTGWRLWAFLAALAAALVLAAFRRA